MVSSVEPVCGRNCGWLFCMCVRHGLHTHLHRLCCCSTRFEVTTCRKFVDGNSVKVCISKQEDLGASSWHDGKVVVAASGKAPATSWRGISVRLDSDGSKFLSACCIIMAIRNIPLADMLLQKHSFALMLLHNCSRQRHLIMRTKSAQQCWALLH